MPAVRVSPLPDVTSAAGVGEAGSWIHRCSYIGQWRRRLSACVKAWRGHFEHLFFFSPHSMHLIDKLFLNKMLQKV